LGVDEIWSFLAVAVPLVLTPGASTAVVLRNSIAGGARAGIQTAVGVNSGSVLYGFVSAFGLALAIERWPSAWDVLRWAGTLYLAWLGARALHAAIWPREPVQTYGVLHAAQPVARNVYEGVLTNALNPAIATFYLVIVPRFVPRGAPLISSVLILTAIHVTIAFTCHLVWALAGGTMARALMRGRGRRLLELCTGAALLGLALRMAARS
jgi:threonine/homoserine/homoserine lactone efflux protein